MGIREQEDELFEAWRRKIDEKPFVIDGAPFPEEYGQSAPRVLFVLKECNLGSKYPHDQFDLRAEMREDSNPNRDKWWPRVADWCHMPNTIGGHEPGWSEFRDWRRDVGVPVWVRDGLRRYTFMQLNKIGAGGKSDKGRLRRRSRNHAPEIRSQISIYKPDLIVAAGTGEFVREVLGCGSKRLVTSRGVRYWDVPDSLERPVRLIDFCHPSARCGRKAWPSIVYGLRDACEELVAD